MDILTLGKMNAMARDVDVTLEYLANATFQALKDVCDVQEGMESNLNTIAQNNIDEVNAAGPNRGIQTREYFNDCARGCHCMVGCSDTFTVPPGTKTIMFEAWGGGGAGAGHCCQGCWCDMASCGSNGGFYGRKTICAEAGHFDGVNGGDVYSICVGDGGNGSSHCWTACCDAPRGCASYVTGPGLTNFCAVGGRGGYNLYCTCQCNMSHCWSEAAHCHGMIMCAPTGCNQATNIDSTGTGSVNGQMFEKEQLSAGHCDCGGRFTRTAQSDGLTNSIMQHIGHSMSYCGCETPCYSFRHAGGGMNTMKAYCGNPLENCLGSPGRPGLVRVTYA